MHLSVCNLLQILPELIERNINLAREIIQC